jgi:hypothetical protein
LALGALQNCSQGSSICSRTLCFTCAHAVCLPHAFDPHSIDVNGPSFTLHTVILLRLDTRADFIASLSSTASKEQAIEAGLSSIEATWACLNLDIVQHKSAHKLRSADEIFATLDDSCVTLSSMKASKHYLIFKATVTHWETTLSLVSETMEVILQASTYLLFSWEFLVWLGCMCSPDCHNAHVC